MRPRDLVGVLKAAYHAKQTTMLWGGPGVGKSSLVREVTDSLNITLLDRRISQMESVDLRGLPVPDLHAQLTMWLESEDLPNVKRDGEHGVLLLDEINHAPKSIRAACFQLILDRRVGKYRLPDGWVAWAAGNRAKDRALTEQLETPLKNRFMHLTLEVHNEDWIHWALKRGLTPQVISFIRQFPTMLNEFEELVNGPAERRRSLDDMNAFATPRSWEFLDRMYRQGGFEGQQMEVFSGIVGDNAAIKFTAHLTMHDKLPNLDHCIQDPEKAPVPTDPVVLYALATSLAARTTPQNLKQVLTYIGRIKDAEYQVLTVKDAAIRHKEIMDTDAFNEWAARNRHVLL